MSLGNREERGLVFGRLARFARSFGFLSGAGFGGLFWGSFSDF